MGLRQWAPVAHATLSQPKIDFFVSVGTGADGKASINLGPQLKDAKAYQVAISMKYGLVRSSWLTGKSKQTFPNETNYRHSLAEEVEALQAAADEVARDAKDNSIKAPDPALVKLTKLRDEGLLEPYALFARADAGIAQGYPAYRDAHGDKLRQYPSEWVIATGAATQ
jgi:hypothetical protein